MIYVKMIKIDNISLIMRGARANHVESIKLQQRRIRMGQNKLQVSV